MSTTKINKTPLTTSLSILTFILIGLLLLQWLALGIHDHIFSVKAQNNLDNIKLNGTTFIWDMSSPRSILDHEQHGLGDLIQDKTGLHFKSSNNDPYFWLNLAGRSIDATRYQQIEIELFASQKTRLNIVFDENDSNSNSLYKHVIVSSQRNVMPGWQTLSIDLEQLSWRHAGRDTKKTAHWGGRNGVVSALRIDPSNHKDTELHIRSIKLIDKNYSHQINMATPDHWIAVTHSTNQEELLSKIDPNNTIFPIFYDNSSWRTVENSLFLREKIRNNFPNAILFPNNNKIDDEQYNFGKNRQKEDLQKNKLLNFQPIIVTILLQSIACGLSILVALCLLFRHSNITQSLFKYRYFPLSIILLFFICLWGLSSTETAEGVIQIIGCGFIIFTLQLLHFRHNESPLNWPQKLGLINASKPCWIITLLSTTTILLIVIALSYYFDTSNQIDKKILLQNSWRYPIWGLIQQLILGPILGAEIFRLMYKGNTSTLSISHKSDSTSVKLWPVALTTGLIFGLLHTPNSALMSVTFVLGSFWCYLYLRYKSIVPLAIAHGLLASLFRELAPKVLRMDGDIGLSYYHWLWI